MKGKLKSQLWQWQQRAREQDLSCARCGRFGLMTVDHIVPVFFLEALGLRFESYEHDWNFQYLCRACNSLKRSGFDFTNKTTIINLRRYTDLAEEIYAPEKTTEKLDPLLSL